MGGFTALDRRTVIIIIGGVILLLASVLPPPAGLSRAGLQMLGLLGFGAFFWITEPIPMAITALLVIVLQAAFRIRTAAEVFHSFGNKALFFLIGAFMLAAAIEKSELHKRFALGFLQRFRARPRTFTLGIMVTCAGMSFIMPEHAVAALMLPIVLSIVVALEVIPGESNFGIVSMLAIAYGCSIGSLGTLIGGARNPLTIGFLSEVMDIRLSFLDWITLSWPVVLFSVPLVWFVLTRLYPIEIEETAAAHERMAEEVAALGEFGGKERTVLIVLAGTIAAWVGISLFPSWSDYLGLAGIALLAGVALFFTRTLSWKDVEHRMPWGIVLLYGGAITLGVGLESAGAAKWLAGNLLALTGQNAYILIFVLVGVTIALTEAMSNTAAVAIMLPIAFGISQQIAALTPLLVSMLVALTGGLAFMLVIATPGNAIVYSSGYFKPRHLLKAGVGAHLICIPILLVTAFTYWRFLGVW